MGAARPPEVAYRNYMRLLAESKPPQDNPPGRPALSVGVTIPCRCRRLSRRMVGTGSSRPALTVEPLHTQFRSGQTCDALLA